MKIHSGIGFGASIMAVHCFGLVFACGLTILNKTEVVYFSDFVVWVDLFLQLILFG